jgi:hypothetical protein
VFRFLRRKPARFTTYAWYSLNVTNHGNFNAVYNNVTAPNFGQFVGFLDRRDGPVIDFIDGFMQREFACCGIKSLARAISTCVWFGKFPASSRAAAFLCRCILLEYEAERFFEAGEGAKAV